MNFKCGEFLEFISKYIQLFIVCRVSLIYFYFRIFQVADGEFRHIFIVNLP